MNNFFSTIILFGFSQSVTAVESVDYSPQFQQAKIICGKAQGQTCYQSKMINLMKQTPENRELILQAALSENPEHLIETVQTAIEAGMAPLVTLKRAIEIFPERRDEIEKGATNAGVDPFVATEATIID